MPQERLSQDLFIQELRALLGKYPQYSNLLQSLIKQIQSAQLSKKASLLEKLRG
jgi:hypothetical protein